MSKTIQILPGRFPMDMERDFPLPPDSNVLLGRCSWLASLCPDLRGNSNLGYSYQLGMASPGSHNIDLEYNMYIFELWNELVIEDLRHHDVHVHSL